jgi:hypothetical protein
LQPVFSARLTAPSCVPVRIFAPAGSLIAPEMVPFYPAANRYVEAVNRYHAFGLGMHGLKRCSWCNPEFHGVERLTVQLLDKQDQRRLTVTRAQFEQWLTGPPDLGDTLREHLQMLLGRKEPSRDFLRLIKSR